MPVKKIKKDIEMPSLPKPSPNPGPNTKLIAGFYIILVLVLIQTAFIAYLSYNGLIVIPKNLDSSISQLNKKIDLNNADIESKIQELSSNLINVRTDLGQQIGSIKATTSADFSGLIQTAKESVVSIRTNAAQGTGFIITDDCYIVTNAHVLSGARYADAIDSNQLSKELDLIGYNTTLDVALLKMQGDCKSLTLRDSDNIIVGEKVIAIGNPLGLDFSVSEGIVSAINRKGSNNLPAYIQTDAALNPGNSGGPLIGTDGKVLGINNFKAKGENLGFALESNYIKQGINQIAEKNLNMTILD